jgi:hypothetical protein
MGLYYLDQYKNIIILGGSYGYVAEAFVARVTHSQLAEA